MKAINIGSVAHSSFVLLAVAVAPALCTSATATAEHHKASTPAGCNFQHGGKMLFLGSAECFKTVPVTRMRGLWVIGLEESIFFEGKSALPPKSAGAVWLDVDVAQAIRPTGVHVDGQRHRFIIVFNGRKGPTPGIYGHMGQYESGIYIEKILSIKAIE